jgi:hypothetical protein
MENLVVYFKDMLDARWGFYWLRLGRCDRLLGWFDNNKGPTVIALGIFVEFGGRNGFGLQGRCNETLELDWFVVDVEL